MKAIQALSVFLFLVIFALCSTPLTGNAEPRATAQSEQAPRSREESLRWDKKSEEDVSKLISLACGGFYPPLTVHQCVDKVKHGIGAAFDPHSRYMNKDEYEADNQSSAGEFSGIGLRLAKQDGEMSPIIVESVIEDTAAHKAGIMAGDIITHIYSSGDDKREPVSSRILTISEAVKLLRGKEGTIAQFRVIRQPSVSPIEVKITRQVVKTPRVKGELLRIANKTYVLIVNSYFNDDNAAAMKAKYEMLEKEAGGRKKLSGLIISVEDNPGGSLYEVTKGANLFLDAPMYVLVRGSHKTEVYTPRDEQLDITSKSKRVVKKGDITKGLPLLVVVDGVSASASEIFAGELQYAFRATIAGTKRTFGKGSVQTQVALPDGGAFKVTTSEYMIGIPTDWVPIQCVGVTPDILFEYEGVKTPPTLTDCDLLSHMPSAGAMKDAPLRIKMKEKNPEEYRIAEEMLAVYKAHRTPQLRALNEAKKSKSQL